MTETVSDEKTRTVDLTDSEILFLRQLCVTRHVEASYFVRKAPESAQHAVAAARKDDETACRLIAKLDR